MLVAVAKPFRKDTAAVCGALVGPKVRPLVEECLDEAFGLGVCLRTVGPSEAVTNPKCFTRLRKSMGDVRGTVVGQKSPLSVRSRRCRSEVAEWWCRWTQTMHVRALENQWRRRRTVPVELRRKRLWRSRRRPRVRIRSGHLLSGRFGRHEHGDLVSRTARDAWYQGEPSRRDEGARSERRAPSLGKSVLGQAHGVPRAVRRWSAAFWATSQCCGRPYGVRDGAEARWPCGHPMYGAGFAWGRSFYPAELLSARPVAPPSRERRRHLYPVVRLTPKASQAAAIDILFEHTRSTSSWRFAGQVFALEWSFIRVSSWVLGLFLFPASLEWPEWSIQDDSVHNVLRMHI